MEKTISQRLGLSKDPGKSIEPNAKVETYHTIPFYVTYHPAKKLYGFIAKGTASGGKVETREQAIELAKTFIDTSEEATP